MTHRSGSVAAALIAAALVTTGLAGCVANVDQHGHPLAADEIAKVHPGKTTRAEVVKLLGTPSSTGVFDTHSWYYIARKTKQVAFLDPEVLNQQVYVLNFDGNGVVQSIEHKNLKNAREIVPAPGATPAPGRHLTFLEQIIGNIGRFDRGSSGPDTGPPSQGGPKPYDPNH